MNNSIPEWYNSFSIYVEFYNELVNIYKKVSSMTLEERFSDPFSIVRPIADMSTLISRIIPFTIHESTRTVSIVNDENLDYLTEYLSFVGIDLRDIVSQRNELLFKLGAIRNKYEHVPHSVKSKYVSGSNDASDVVFDMQMRSNNTPYSEIIGTDEIAFLIEDISEVISKVAKHIMQDIEQNHSEYRDYPYYKLLEGVSNKVNLLWNF